MEKKGDGIFEIDDISITGKKVCIGKRSYTGINPILEYKVN